MNPAVEKLKGWIKELESLSEFSSIEEKAEHIGLINQIDTSIKRIELCEKWGIYPKSIVKKLPYTDVTEYRIVDDGECGDKRYWEEVTFDDGKPIYLQGGDLIVKI